MTDFLFKERGNEDVKKKILKYEQITNNIQSEIDDVLVKLSSRPLEEKHRQELKKFSKMKRELGLIADQCCLLSYSSLSDKEYELKRDHISFIVQDYANLLMNHADGKSLLSMESFEKSGMKDIRRSIEQLKLLQAP